MRRKEFTKKDKDRRIKEYNGFCEVCGVLKMSEFHHIKGGSNSYSNMAGLCPMCHALAGCLIPSISYKRFKEEGGAAWSIFGQASYLLGYMDARDGKEMDDNFKDKIRNIYRKYKE